MHGDNPSPFAKKRQAGSELRASLCYAHTALNIEDGHHRAEEGVTKNDWQALPWAPRRETHTHTHTHTQHPGRDPR